jgi:polysaccharide export outer membrane protein
MKKGIIFTALVLIIILATSLMAAEYHLHIDDRLLISVWGHEDLQAEVIVGPDGTINLPLVGSIKAEGLTVTELTQKVTAKFAEYIKNPQVNIALKEYKRTSIMVLGEVNRPGAYKLEPGSRVLDAISLAGGFNKTASLGVIKLTRGEKVQALDLEAVLSGGNLAGNILVQDGDVIYVPETLIEVNIVGEVKRPGRYELQRGVKLTDLLAEAGGLTMTAAVIGEYTTATDKELINLKDLLAGKTGNPVLKDGDMLYIPESRARITINGEVQKPGTYPWEEGLTLSALLARAGNRNAAGDLEKVRLIHADNTEEVINLAGYINEGKVENNPVLEPGDSVFIPEKSFEVTVLGEVNRPGAYSWKPELKLSGLLARAGNPTERGDTDNIIITRQDGTIEEINFNETDPVLKPGDTVTLEEVNSIDWQKVFTYIAGFKLIKDFLEIDW